MSENKEPGRHHLMKTTIAILFALMLAGCSSPKPPSDYNQDTTPGDDGSTYGGYLDSDSDR